MAEVSKRHLHSTMVLLKFVPRWLIVASFTNLHSTMVLLKLPAEDLRYSSFHHLHSTMVLLKWICNKRSAIDYVFTFHYGSTEIRYGSCKIHGKRIYIPLWFYWNMFSIKWVICLVCIYIPLWFYWNKFTFCFQVFYARFTFHYGSTEIRRFFLSLKPVNQALILSTSFI